MTYYKNRHGVTLREEAESRVNALFHAADDDPDVARNKLVHELQVHKLELELQNEELAAAYAELSSIRDKYVDLYDFAPVAYFTVTSVGEIKELNIGAATLVAEKREDLVGRRLNDYMQPGSMLPFADMLAAACDGAGEVIGTLGMVRTNGTDLFIKAQAQRFRLTNGTMTVRIVIMNMSDMVAAA